MTGMLLINLIGMALIATTIVSALVWAIVSHRKHELQGVQVVPVAADRPTAATPAAERTRRQQTRRQFHPSAA